MGALDDLKVADFSWFVAGPLCARYLADYGAEVIHVETSTHIDGVRTLPPYKNDIPGVNRSGYFHNYNSNKYGITLNLENSMSHAAVARLLKWCNVIVESFNPGVMPSLGLGYEDVKKIKPDVIMISLSSKGQSGPHSTLPAVGMHLAALSGFIEVTGWPDRDPALLYGAYTDSIAARFGAAAILAAVDYREHTGLGQYIDLSQYEAGLQFLVPPLLQYSANGKVLHRNGNRDSWAAPHGAYRCRGEDRWCTIAIFTDEEWKSFCYIIGNDLWAEDARFATHSARKANEEALDLLVEGWTINHTPEEVMDRLQPAGISAGVVETAEDLHRDPQLKARRHFWVLDHQEIGPSTYDSLGSLMSETPAELSRAAPVLGQDNYHVYTQILGFSDEEFVQLLQEGVLD